MHLICMILEHLVRSFFCKNEYLQQNENKFLKYYLFTMYSILFFNIFVIFPILFYMSYVDNGCAWNFPMFISLDKIFFIIITFINIAVIFSIKINIDINEINYIEPFLLKHYQKYAAIYEYIGEKIGVLVIVISITASLLIFKCFMPPYSACAI